MAGYINRPKKHINYEDNLNYVEPFDEKLDAYNRLIAEELSLQKIKTSKTKNIYDEISPEEEVNIVKYIGATVGIVSLVTENLLSHPFLVLRRQCQVNNVSVRYHLIPITLIPVVIHLHKRQGITILWKGIGSVLMVRGLSLAIEDLISKFTSLPKELTKNSSLKQFGQHLLLKSITLTIITPFYSASLVETVQSDIASEKPGILDVFREGTIRLFSWSFPNKGRMLPIWELVLPTVTLGLAKYLFNLIVKGSASRIMHVNDKIKQEKQGAIHKNILDQAKIDEIELNSSLISLILTDIAFYPFETILHRLHLQGTRTIIDNLDNGYAVLPILTNFEGTRDCYNKTISTEGVSGLYKGFGALVLQFLAHVAVIKLTKFILIQISDLLRNDPPPNPIAPPAASNLEHSSSAKSLNLNRPHSRSSVAYSSISDSYSIP